MEKHEATLTNYLKENALNLMYVTQDKASGKKCVTHYKVIKSNSEYSLLDINIDTGRKNQIRVQLGHIGHHVVGDDKYGEPKDPLKRLGLHAYKLKFIHPVTKKIFEFKTEMPKEFAKII